MTESFDLVLDLGAAPQIALHQPPQGYFHAADDAALIDAVLELRESVGEFEKPKFFNYRQKICAHSRNEQIGCNACIEVCSARGDPQRRLAQGPHRRRRHRRRAAPVRRLRRLHHGLPERRPELCDAAAGGARPAHPHAPRHLCAGRRQRRGAADPQPGRRRRGSSARSAGRRAPTPAVRGLPARVLPLEVWHTASVGIDLWLSAIAFGAVQVWVLMTDEEAPDYRRAVAAQMEVAQAILTGLGFGAGHFAIVDAKDVAVDASAARARGPALAVVAGSARTTDPALAASTGPWRRRRPSAFAGRRPSASRPTSARRSTWRSTT